MSGDSTTADPLDVSIPLLDDEARQTARDRQAELTKPPGSLGRLETMAAEIAAMQSTTEPTVDPAVVVTMAADHGVVAEGVSAYPQSITAAMVANFCDGGAAVSALCDAEGIENVIVDMGVAGEVPESVVDHSIADGTANIAAEPAMRREQALTAIAAGRSVVEEHASEASLIGLGEMGIGNTTSSAAITALLTDTPVSAVTGHGTGIDEETKARKVAVIERAIETIDPDRTDPVAVLRSVGGFEIAGLVGLTLEAASRRTPVVVDGFIAGAAALLAAEIEPRVTDYLLGSHESVEPGHEAQLNALDLEPCFEYGMRLGEGTGAAIAVGVYRAACAAHNGMSTFAKAGLDGE
ncbi:nicotinate-nucleotide--dimethylbenzimidazole phosphoribosyltransferase [Halohasta litorea]|uniref:Nicotinate-nucleotide--dimethylbenzimidazole phosphoribosyltransferase n=1 Tax=Halohasta litorea TaxID=869891 RepID=A0ABD6DB16_9EURY|nr:nicotinate-nucleotide--dimethylbenzimidazole phosphoribosyltransferase [Halohasta litorea]